MKEFLEPHPNGKYVFVKAEKSLHPSWVEVPEGMNIAWADKDSVWFTALEMGYRDAKVLWQRESLNDKVASAEEYRQAEVLPFIDDEDYEVVDRKELFEKIRNGEVGISFDSRNDSDETKEKHSHYKKDVSHLNILDVYRVLELFDVYNPCLQHAIKKLLCAGQRGAKDTEKDIQEAIDTLIRYKQMREEDNA